MISSDKELHSASPPPTLQASALRAATQLQASNEWSAVRRALGVMADALDADAAHVLQTNSKEHSAEGADPPLRPVVTWHPPGEPHPDAAVPPSLSTYGATKVDREETSDQRRTAWWLHGPVRADGGVWGRIAFRRSGSQLPDDGGWTEDEGSCIAAFADQVGAWLGRTATGLMDWDVQKDGSSGQLPDLEARQLQRRVESQRALVEASKLLVSPGDVAMDELLRIVGHATGADYAYLLSIRPEEGDGLSPLAGAQPDDPPPIDLDAYAHYEWYAPTNTRPRRGHPLERAQPADQDGATLAVPLLSAQHLLFGYLGIEFDHEPSPLTDEDVRLLNVLGDMLSAFLQRQITNRALRESERRYRHFVETISEAIWRVDLSNPVAINQPPDALAQAVQAQGIMAECNSEMAQLFGVESPDELIGWTVERLTKFTGQQIVRDAVDADFRLQSQDYVVHDTDRNGRHFIVNTSAVIDDDQLLSVWGSTTEVTERVQLERRMVTALEQQQQRIGRDLHDSVGQLLTGVRMLAQNLEERQVQPGSEGHPQIQSIINYADEATKHVNNLQRGLMPVQMERAGLAQALQELASNTDVLPDVHCAYEHDGDADVRAPETKLQLYRIAQEATNNALKHADPSTITIALTSSEDMLHLRVEDDGIGFEPDERTGDSLGLHSMYYRARAINAELDVQSTKECGTIVHCRMSLDDVPTDTDSAKKRQGGNPIAHRVDND